MGQALAQNKGKLKPCVKRGPRPKEVTAKGSELGYVETLKGFFLHVYLYDTMKKHIFVGVADHTHEATCIGTMHMHKDAAHAHC